MCARNAPSARRKERSTMSDTETSETEAGAEGEGPSFTDVCLYLADQMQRIVQQENEPQYTADRVAAAQVWLNAAGAYHNAKQNEARMEEILRQSEMMASSQKQIGGLFMPIGMVPPTGVNH